MSLARNEAISWLIGEEATLPDGRGDCFSSIAMTLMVSSLAEEDRISPSKNAGENQ